MTRRLIVLAAVAWGGRGEAKNWQSVVDDTVAVKEVTATSTYADRKQADRYAAWRVIVPDYGSDMGEEWFATAWCEGKPDEGIGEAVTIVFAEPARIDAVQIAAGVWKSEKLFAANNRVSEIELSTDDGRTIVAPLSTRTPTGGNGPTKEQAPIVKIGGAAINTLRVKITKVEKGRFDDSCLSALWLRRGKKELAPIVAAGAARARSRLAVDLAAIASALDGKGDRPDLTKWLDFPFTYCLADRATSGFPCAEPIPDYRAIVDWCRKLHRLKAEKPVEEIFGSPEDAGCVAYVPSPGAVTAVGPGHLGILQFWHAEGHTSADVVWRGDAWHLTGIH